MPATSSRVISRSVGTRDPSCRDALARSLGHRDRSGRFPSVAPHRRTDHVEARRPCRVQSPWTRRSPLLGIPERCQDHRRGARSLAPPAGPRVPYRRPALSMAASPLQRRPAANPGRPGSAPRGTRSVACNAAGTGVSRVPRAGWCRASRPRPTRHPGAAAGDGQVELRGPLRPIRALRRRRCPLRRHDHRRVERLDGQAVRLDQGLA